MRIPCDNSLSQDTHYKSTPACACVLSLGCPCTLAAMLGIRWCNSNQFTAAEPQQLPLNWLLLVLQCVLMCPLSSTCRPSTQTLVLGTHPASTSTTTFTRGHDTTWKRILMWWTLLLVGCAIWGLAGMEQFKGKWDSECQGGLCLESGSG